MATSPDFYLINEAAPDFIKVCAEALKGLRGFWGAGPEVFWLAEYFVFF